MELMRLVMEKTKEIKVDSVLFFDMDGTLIDTSYANFLAYKKAIELVKKSDFNISYDPVNRFNRSLLKNTIPTLTETELGMIIYEKEKCYNDFLTETQLNDKIAGILYKYSRTNKTVLVTKCCKERALATLNHHKLANMFNDFFFRQFEDNVRFNKFQNAISVLGISPKLVIAFENEEIEIIDAKEAGIQYVNPQNL